MNRWKLLSVLPLLWLGPFAQAESMSDKVLQLQQQMAVMQGELSSLIAVQQANKGSQSALANLLQRTQRLEQEMRNLRGELDTKTHRLQNEQQATAAQVQALAAQLAVAAPATGITASTGSAAAGVAPSAATTAAAVASAASNASTPMIQKLGQADYQHAFNFLRRGKYGDAITGLQHFIQKYPQSSLVPDAYYWLGQAQYVLGRNDAALKSLYTVPKHFSQNSKAPEALLRIAEIYQAIGKPAQAGAILNKIIRQYPSTPSAQKAEAQLQALPSR